jgi:hypothetical protein
MPTAVRVAWIALIASFAMQTIAGYSAIVGIRGPLWAWHQGPMAEALWHGPVPADVEPYRSFAMGLLGSTMAGAAVLALLILAIPFRRRERWAWWTILASMAAWYPFDTGVSAALGVWVNVALNTAILTSVLVPLGVCWPWFQDRKAPWISPSSAPASSLPATPPAPPNTPPT